MLKYVKKCQKQLVILACDATGMSQPLCLMSLFVQSGGKRHAPAFRFNTYVMCFGLNRWRNKSQSNLVFVFRTEMPRVWLRRILDHYFNSVERE